LLVFIKMSSEFWCPGEAMHQVALLFVINILYG